MEILVRASIGVIGVVINGLVATIGARQVRELLLDPVRQKMVDEERGPTDEELDAVIASIKARSDRIQSA